MLLERRTIENDGVKSYEVWFSGELKRTFSESDSITAMAEANEFIEDYAINLAVMGHNAEVKYG